MRASSMLALVCCWLGASAAGQEPVSRGMAVELEAGPSLNAYRDRHALVIGVDDYQDAGHSALTYAAKDARGLAGLLVSHLGFPERNVRLVLGADATKSALEEALQEWASDRTRIQAEDLLLIFFAGHGVTRDLGDRGTRGYLVPVDGRTQANGTHSWSSLIAMSDLEEVSEAIPSKHVLFILDCCFGGLAINRAAPPLPAGLGSRARQVLTAGSAEQTVLDGGGGGHSVFTASLLDAMSGSADIDLDQVVTFGELFNYVGRTVSERTNGRQTPLQANLPDHEGGSVALFAPDVKPGATSVWERLKTLERTDQERLEEINGLSDAILVKDLHDQADQLWPRRKHMQERFRAWLIQARRIIANLPRHRSFLQRVRQETYLQQVLAGHLKEGEGTEPLWEQAEPILRWKFEMLRELMAEVNQLEALVPEIEARLEFALSIEQRSLDDFSNEWDQVIAEIESDPAYLGLQLLPQMGLAPIGADPDSGLFEFWHLGTGTQPARDPDSGALMMDGDSGLVFILVPEQTFFMGASSVPEAHPVPPDAYALPNEMPVREVTLAPFFISKYELTQGQWLRATGSNPSEFAPGITLFGTSFSLLHPVETVSWNMCAQTLQRLELTIPTEAQWECAARAGTQTPWFTGDHHSSLQGAANIADLSAIRAGTAWNQNVDFMDDGFVHHAPVNALRANPFGLHMVHGNVWEWCRDVFGSYRGPRAVGDGEHQIDSEDSSQTTDDAERACRSGGFMHEHHASRSAFRINLNPNSRGGYIGIRPARPLIN